MGVRLSRVVRTAPIAATLAGLHLRKETGWGLESLFLPTSCHCASVVQTSIAATSAVWLHSFTIDLDSSTGVILHMAGGILFARKRSFRNCRLPLIYAVRDGR